PRPRRGVLPPPARRRTPPHRAARDGPRPYAAGPEEPGHGSHDRGGRTHGAANDGRTVRAAPGADGAQPHAVLPPPPGVREGGDQQPGRARRPGTDPAVVGEE